MAKRSRTKADAKLDAVHRQAAVQGCADPLGYARWAFDEETAAVRLKVKNPQLNFGKGRRRKKGAASAGG